MQSSYYFCDGKGLSIFNEYYPLSEKPGLWRFPMKLIPMIVSSALILSISGPSFAQNTQSAAAEPAAAPATSTASAAQPAANASPEAPKKEKKKKAKKNKKKTEEGASHQ